MKYVICPTCGRSFQWDEIGTHDECPNTGCHASVNCIENEVGVETYIKKYEAELFEMRTGLQITKFDYIHRNCGTPVQFNMDTGTFFCPKCHLTSGMTALLDAREG